MQCHGFSYPHKPICAIENMTEIEIGRQGGKDISLAHQCSCRRPTKVAYEQHKILPIICLEGTN